MFKEEQSEVFGSTMLKRAERKRELACCLMQAERFGQELRRVAEILPEGREEDRQLILELPSADTVANLHGNICSLRDSISKYDSLLQQHGDC